MPMKSLTGYSPWGRKESDTTERLSTQRCLMGYPLDPPELPSLKLGIENNRDQVFHFPSQEAKWQGLNFHKLEA